MPYIGRSTEAFGVRTRYTYTPSAGDTSVSGADVNGLSLSFTDGAYVDVFLNGVRLKHGTDYVTTTANTIGSLAALAASDEVEVVVFDVFSLADMVSSANGGNFFGQVNLKTDSGVIGFGADSEITLTHSADSGLLLKHTATSGSGASLTLQTGETDIAQDYVLGTIAFQAPDEGTGTDAILVAANISAISEGDFSSSSNATSLFFATGASEDATEKMRLTSAGKLMVGATSPQSFNGTTAAVQIEGLDNNGGSLSITRNSNDNGQPLLIFGKTRGTSDGANTLVQQGDVCGQIVWIAGDGTDKVSQVASITANINAAAAANDTPGNIQFRTTSDGSNSDSIRMTIENDGDVTIEDGDLIIGTSGHGIDFSATANSSVTGTGNQAELLADYEKGTWTPADNNGNVTFAQKQGSYIKIGDQVTAWGFINTPSSVSDTNAVQISGLPFTTAAAGDAASGTAARGHGTIGYQDFTTNMVHIHTVRDSQIVQMFDSSGAITYNELTGSKTVMFGVTYHTGIA